MKITNKRDFKKVIKKMLKINKIDNPEIWHSFRFNFKTIQGFKVYKTNELKPNYILIGKMFYNENN